MGSYEDKYESMLDEGVKVLTLPSLSGFKNDETKERQGFIKYMYKRLVDLERYGVLSVKEGSELLDYATKLLKRGEGGSKTGKHVPAWDKR